MQAFRAAIWAALPFIFFLVGVERIFDQHGTRYEVLWRFGLSVLSVLLVVYWNRLMPRRWRQVTKTPLEYLVTVDSELSRAIRNMGEDSAWAKWFASQALASGEPLPQAEV